MYSLRLDSEEVAALEVQAAARGLKPSVLARNLIRVGLRARTTTRWVRQCLASTMRSPR